MTEEECKALFEKYVKEEEKKYHPTTQEQLPFPKEMERFQDNVLNVATWLAYQVSNYLDKELHNPQQAFEFSVLIGYVAIRLGEILFHDGKEIYIDDQINEGLSYLDALEVVKFNLDKRIEEMKKLKESSNG